MSSKHYPWRCLCLGLLQITITFPWRRITRHLGHIFFTDALTFIFLLKNANYVFWANDGDRTREWRSHSPLPYHLATPARHLYNTISKIELNVYIFSRKSYKAGDVIRTRNVQLVRMALYHWVTPACSYNNKPNLICLEVPEKNKE